MLMKEDLTRPCDACGGFIGGGYRFCPKCKIHLCIGCGLALQASCKVYPVKCPMCQGILWFPSERKELMEEIYRNYLEREKRKRKSCREFTGMEIIGNAIK